MPRPEAPPGASQTQPPKLVFDWREWIVHLDDQDASEAKKRAAIEAVWSIVLTFVDLQWEVVGREKSCGQDFDLAAALAAAVVNSEEEEAEREDA